ncbi:MAG: hypothetical protein NVSMB18_27970 [Acetobacteraceae bacterium]
MAVVIPSYKVRKHILPLLERIGPEVSQIYVVDDACPEGSGAHVRTESSDPRVVVLVHNENQGVGGAVITGYQHAIAAGANVVIKLDGDGQMDPALIPQFVAPILEGRADYVKGNRFYNIEDVSAMPKVRLIGNAALSFITKLSSGYWTLFDPTNGYTAISASLLSNLPLHKLQRRYFFESDLLFRLGTMQAVVLDLPMAAVYGEEASGLNIRRILLPFLFGNLGNLGKRIFYSYFLRGFSIASLELVIGLSFLVFGVVFGLQGWVRSVQTGLPATTGTVMLAALPVILGVQMLLSFLAFDFAATPVRPVSPLLPPNPAPKPVLARLRQEPLVEKTPVK